MTDNSLTPTDAEIVTLMRDGNNCNYNDENEHIDFARAVLAKWGAFASASHPIEVPAPHYGNGRYLGFARYNDAYSVAQVQDILAAKTQPTTE